MLKGFAYLRSTLLPLMETIQAQTRKIEDSALVLMETRADKVALEEKVRFMEGRVTELSSWKHRSEELESALGAARTKIQSDRNKMENLLAQMEKMERDHGLELTEMGKRIDKFREAARAAQAARADRLRPACRRTHSSLMRD